MILVANLKLLCNSHKETCGEIKMLKAVVAGIVSLGVLAGCATNDGGYTKSDDVEDRLMEMTSLEVVSKLGAPTEAMQVSSDTQVWTYRSNSNSNSLTGGKCTVSVTVADEAVIAASVISMDRSFVSFPLGACAPVIGNLN